MTGFLLTAGPRAGIACGNCGARLALSVRRPVLIVIGGLAVALLMAYFIDQALGRAEARKWQLLAFIPLFGAFMFGQAFAQVRVAQAGESLRIYGDPFKQMAEDLAPVHAAAAAEAEAEAERVREINAPGRTPWICSQCKSDNPATFDICWNCQSQRQ